MVICNVLSRIIIFAVIKIYFSPSFRHKQEMYLVMIIEMTIRNVVLITIIMTITFVKTLITTLAPTLTVTHNTMILMQFKSCGWRPKDLCVLSQEIP